MADSCMRPIHPLKAALKGKVMAMLHSAWHNQRNVKAQNIASDKGSDKRTIGMLVPGYWEIIKKI